MTYRIQKDSIHEEDNGLHWGWCLNRCAWVFNRGGFSAKEIDGGAA